MTADTGAAPVASPAPAQAAGAPLVSEVSITAAFTAGCLMTDLLDLHAAAGEALDTLAVGGSSLSATDRRYLLAQRLQTELGRLADHFQQAGVPSRLSARLTEVDSLLGELVDTAADAQATARIAAHTPSLELTLMAGDARLGEAYVLGRELDETCGLRDDPKSLAAAFDAHLDKVRCSLADLASSLPDHSSRAVSVSLAAWQQWARKNPVSLPDADVQAAMLRQRELWRTILSGQKLGKDMLMAQDYIDASKALWEKMFRSRRLVVLVPIAVVVLLAVGVYVFLHYQSAKNTATTVTGLVLPVLGAVGISAASLKRRLTGIGTELEAQLWGAELDLAIAQAVTLEPARTSVKFKKLDVPPRGPDRSRGHPPPG